jgi:hypothetical protein
MTKKTKSHSYNDAIQTAEWDRMAAWTAADNALDDAVAPFYKAYRKAVKHPQKVLDESTIPFSEAHSAAYDKAEKAYQKAVKKARKEYMP